MEEARLEQASARLCLLTHAAWDASMPRPLTRRQVHQLYASGALCGLVLRESCAEEALLERARRLLSRVSDVYRLILAYESAGYTLLLPGEARWPGSLSRLGADMPLFLFCRGNAQLLDGRRISVAGSRVIGAQAKSRACSFGRLIAQAGMVLVSGGAAGVDSAAQEAALDAGGSVIVVPAVKAGEIAAKPCNAKALSEGKLLILCDTLPDEPFSPAKALERNHTIYALGERAVVLAARNGVGGSWRGAVDCLKNGGTPLYALSESGEDYKGNAALIRLGALPLAFSGQDDGDALLFAGKTLLQADAAPLPVQTVLDVSGEVLA